MAWTEQVERRSQKAKHFYDAETGRYRAEFGIHDLHYHTGLAWDDVDESLIDDTGNFNKRCDKTRHKVHFAGNGRRRWYPRRNVDEYVEITGIEYWTDQGGGHWRNLTLPAAVWKKQGAVWERDDLRIEVVNTWRKVKEIYTLLNGDAPNRLRFAVAFTGLTYNHDTGELTSTTDGLVWGTIDKPTATDANEAPVTVTATYADGWIEWSTDTTGAAYPITVDPTFTDGDGGDANSAYDTYIYKLATTTNYGTNNNLLVGERNDASNAVGRALVKFAIDSIPSGSSVTSATLTLGLNYAGYSSNNRAIRVYRLKRAWTETGATWNTYDGTNNWSTAGGFHTDDCEQTDIGYITQNTTDSGYFNWTLTTSAIQEMISGGSFTNNGFLIKADTETDDCYRYDSSDGEPTSTELVVEYTAGGASSSVSPSLSPSASVSPSSSESPSLSPSSSASPSVSPSSSESASLSPSASESPSLSPSSSESPSISPSASASSSASPSLSPSISVSPSISPSSSGSPSLSPSFSISPSASASPSISPSYSISPSASASASPSASVAPSGMVEWTLHERSFAWTLHERSLAWTLEDR